MIRIMCSGSSATSATAARMMCGAWVVMYTVSLEVDRFEVGDRPAALDRRRVRPRVVQVQLGDHVRLGEGPLGARGVADRPVVDDVAGLVLLVVADDRGALGHGLVRVHDDRQRLVVDVDRLARVLGDVGGRRR